MRSSLLNKFKSTDEDEAVRKTSLREVKCLRTIKHDNIIQLKEAFKKKGRLYLVFEFWDKNLLNLLEEFSGGLEPDMMKSYLYQLLISIEYCHRNGVIHRDIKPENVLIIEETNTLKLWDFGFARSLPSKSGVELTDYVATRWYRSPELLLKTAYGKPADMWAIGWIMGEMADGEALFPGDSEIDQLFQIQKILGRFPDELNEEFSRNPRYLGYKFPDLLRPETLEKRYIGRLSKKALSLMGGLLELLPENRLTAVQALAHPYFDGVRDPEIESYLNSKKAKKAPSKAIPRVNAQTKEKAVKKMRSKNSVSPSQANDATKSKPRINKFSDISSNGDKGIDNVYRSLSKGPSISKNPVNPPSQITSGERFTGDKVQNKFMPSNLSGFYMPYTNSGNEDVDRYDYAIDINNDRRAEESKMLRKPPTRKSVLNVDEEEDNEEDNIAIPIEESKSGSCSPNVRHHSTEKQSNSSFLQKSSVKHKAKIVPSVPAAQALMNQDQKWQEPGRNANVQIVLEECSDDDSSNSEPTMDNQTRMVRKLSNNGKQLIEKKMNKGPSQRGSRFNELYANPAGVPLKTREDDNSLMQKKIPKYPQSNQNLVKPGFAGAGGMSMFTFDRNDNEANQYNYAIPDDRS